MTLAATFLGGAKSRLLPVSIPFRYFAAASVFHCLAWGLLAARPAELIGFVGGLGAPLAALHLLTIGVLAMTAMGAAFQLLPVATVQPLSRQWPARAAFWLVTPGLVALIWGMATGSLHVLGGGAAAVILALLVFAGAVADNLRRARSLPVVAAHGWGALASLLALLTLAGLLSADYSRGFLRDHQGVAIAHFILASYGFMGLLALGFSYVLVPMFSLSPAPPQKLGWTSVGLAVAALVLAVAGVLGGKPMILVLAALAGLGAASCYLASMAWVWKRRMRKRLGLSFVLVRASWGMLLAGLLLGLALALGAPVRGGGTLFGFLVLAGWLLTFLLGILQRILPFLASMHAAKGQKRPPMVSELTAEQPLKANAICHGVAVALVTAGIVVESALLVRLGAMAGLAGALTFGWFTIEVLRRLFASQAPRS